MSQVPPEVRAEVIRHLYSRAEQLDWENLGVREKSRQYSVWLEDEAVGGWLLNFIPSDVAVRVWMKDGPMKEYSRAVLGVGPNAKYVEHPRCTPESVVSATLGEQWTVVPDSIEVKPARCRAQSSEGETVVIWGRAKDFRYLVFAVLELLVSGVEAAVIAIVETPATPTGKAARERMQAIAQRCGAKLRFINPKRPVLAQP